MSAFASAIDALFADPNIGEDALWKAGGVRLGVAVRIIRKSPDRMAEFGESRAVLPGMGLDTRRLHAATITEGDLILVSAGTFKILGEPMGDAFGLPGRVRIHRSDALTGLGTPPSRTGMAVARLAPTCRKLAASDE